jgi:hypothetical protein
MTAPTIIPAQPGYYIAEPTFTDDTDEVTGIALTPVVAWLLKYQPVTDDDFEAVTVEPIGMEGWCDDGDIQTVGGAGPRPTPGGSATSTKKRQLEDAQVYGIQCASSHDRLSPRCAANLPAAQLTRRTKTGPIRPNFELLRGITERGALAPLFTLLSSRPYFFLPPLESSCCACSTFFSVAKAAGIVGMVAYQQPCAPMWKLVIMPFIAPPMTFPEYTAEGVGSYTQ